MVYVYLDQQHWINLLKAEAGHAGGADYVSVLAELRARRVKTALFPLSSAHYIELNKIADNAKRSALGALMYDLSRAATILPHARLLPMELDRALQETFGLPEEVREAPIFGYGVSHAFAIAPPRLYQPLEGVTLPDDVLVDIQLQGRVFLERMMLVTTALEGRDKAVAGHFEHAANFVAAVENERERLIKYGYDRGERLTRAIAMEVLTETPHIVEAVARARIPPDDVYALGRDGLLGLLDKMPSSVVTLEMRRFAQSQPHRSWSGNDLVDIAALSIAIPYCDVVVTERQWAHLANARGLAKRYETTVLHDLRELPRLIDELNAARASAA